MKRRHVDLVAGYITALPFAEVSRVFADFAANEGKPSGLGGEKWAPRGLSRQQLTTLYEGARKALEEAAATLGGDLRRSHDVSESRQLVKQPSESEIS